MRTRVSVGQWIFLAIVAAFLGAAITILIILLIGQTSSVQETPQEQTTEETRSAEESESNDAADELPVQDILDGWSIFDDDRSELVFSYPSEWGAPDVSAYVPTEELHFIPVEALIVEFEKSDLVTYRSIEITQREDYADTSAEDYAEQLQEIFRTGSLDGADPLWLPPSNAAIIYSSTPQFIESSDEAMRGMFYYTLIAQNDLQQNQDVKQLNQLVMVLTDENGNFFQYQVHVSDEDADYESIGKCNAYDALVDCEVNTLLLDAFENTYKYLPEGIKAAS